MELTDSQISYFVDNRLRLPKGKRTEYLGQVDRLIEKFAAAAKGDDVIGVKKFLKTGSYPTSDPRAPGAQTNSAMSMHPSRIIRSSIKCGDSSR
jgi:hypothetical protein